MCSCVLLPCTCFILAGCPLHGIYFSLRTTCANTRGGNPKWEEESATGRTETQKGYIVGKSARGRKRWNRQVPLESFSLLARLNPVLWVRKTHTHSGPSLDCSPSLGPLPLLNPFFYSSSNSLLPDSQFGLCIIFLSPFLSLIFPFSPGHSQTHHPDFHFVFTYST